MPPARVEMIKHSFDLHGCGQVSAVETSLDERLIFSFRSVEAY